MSALPFIRSDLAAMTAYTLPPGGHGDDAEALDRPLDRLDTNENPLDLPAALKAEIAQVYVQTIAANRYPDGSHGALKAAIAAYVEESALLPAGTIQSPHISVGNGSDELIRSVLIATCLGGAGSILVAQPTFSMYGILAQTLGIPVQTIGRSPETFELDLAAGSAAIAAAPTPVRVVFMVHPNSPTGNALTAAELDWLRDLPASILVVIDEAYFEFSQTSVVAELAAHPNWLILRTFSKAFRLAAHRVGYAIAHPELITTLEKIRLPYNLPSLSQVAAQVALTHRQELLAQIPALLAERSRVYDTLSTHPYLRLWPSAANFVFLRLQTEVEASTPPSLAQLFAHLLEQGTLIRQTANGLRLTIGTRTENQHTCDRLLAALPAPSLC